MTSTISWYYVAYREASLPDQVTQANAAGSEPEETAGACMSKEIGRTGAKGGARKS